MQEISCTSQHDLTTDKPEITTIQKGKHTKNTPSFCAPAANFAPAQEEERVLHVP